MKFIIVERKFGENQVHIIPVIFSKDLVHMTVYEQTKEMIKSNFQGVQYVRCVSAGECHDNRFYGESVTLGIKCHPKTEEVMLTIDYISIFDKNANPFNN